MSHRKVLVYTDARLEGATYQIRIAAPLHQAGLEVIHFDDVPLQSVDRIVSEEVVALIIHRGIRKRCQVYNSLVTAARQAGKPVIYDVDDLLVNVPEEHPDFSIYQSRALGALKVLTDADLVVASTPNLADHLLALHQHVTVIPNQLPARIWSPVTSGGERRSLKRCDGPVTIGYIGTPTHTPDLQSIEESLLTVLDRHAGHVRLLTVGLAPSHGLRRHPAVEQRTPPRDARKNYTAFAQYAAHLPIDIGIAPLLDTTFNQCKSDIKFQEYATLGIPGIYSDLPPYRDSVADGQTGLLAGDAADWTTAMTRLIKSSALRTRLTEAAMQEITSARPPRPDETTWNEALQRAQQLANDPVTSLQRKRAAALVGQLFSYQFHQQRQLKHTLEYQIGKVWQRIVRKVA